MWAWSGISEGSAHLDFLIPVKGYEQSFDLCRSLWVIADALFSGGTWQDLNWMQEEEWRRLTSGDLLNKESCSQSWVRIEGKLS